MSTGDSNDIVARVKAVIPNRWFAWIAPIRDAILGGLSDVAAWNYQLYQFAILQSRIATSTGIYLDLIAYDYLQRFLVRNGNSDDVFRATILATVLQERVTRAGMINAVTELVNTSPGIFEPWNTGDAGGYSTPFFAYGRAGGWGSLQYPAQVFMKVSRSGLGATGIPNIAGYGSPQGGYNIGNIEYVSGEISQTGVTDGDIYNIIKMTKPTGVICWVRIS